MKLSKDLIKRVEEITVTDYNFNDKGETDNWDILVEDLIREYESLLEDYDDYKEYVRDRYER